MNHLTVRSCLIDGQVVCCDDRLTSNRIEAQSELNRIEWGNHEKGKEARQVQDFVETTSEVEEEFKACRRQVETRKQTKTKRPTKSKNPAS